MFSTGWRGLHKLEDIAIGGGLANCPTMPGTSSWQLRPNAPTVAPKTTSSIMGSHEYGIKHTEATGKTRSGSEKPPATKGVGT
jgi:hypothetical protein